MKQIIQDIYITVGIPESDVFRIFIIQDPTANAFATPDGRVFLHSGLFALENLTFEDIVGVVAHEISHFLLQHSLEGAYQIQKKLKRNDLVSGIVAAAGNASETFNSVRYDNYERKNTVRKADLQSILDEETFGKFRFKYSRGQETEADIIAFRFLDFIGVGGEHYIDVLAKLGIDEISSEESYHPSIADRIALLEYMASKRQ